MGCAAACVRAMALAGLSPPSREPPKLTDINLAFANALCPAQHKLHDQPSPPTCSAPQLSSSVEFNPSNGIALVLITSASNATGVNVSHYLMEFEPVPNTLNAPLTQPCNSDSDICELTGLQVDTTYCMQMKAVGTKCVSSNLSNKICFTTSCSLASEAMWHVFSRCTCASHRRLN